MELEYLQALLSGNLAVVNAFLAAGMPVDKLFHIGSNSGAALHLAASTGQVAVVNRLLKAQADVNGRQLHGATPLFLAAEFGHAEVAELLLRSGANADLPRWDSGDTPLHMASDKGHMAVVDKLVSAGSDVNLEQEVGCTPIYMAAQNGHRQVVDRLINTGADIDWRCRTNGNSALHAATQNGHIRIVCSLVRAAVNVNLANHKGETALHFAAQNGQLRIVKTLLKAGADAGARASNGCSPIHTAAQNGNLSVVKALIAAQADLNAVELEGASPLYIAAQNGHQKVIKTLVEAQAIVDHRRQDGVSTLYIAAQEGHHEVVRLLVRHGAARLNTRTGAGEIPLHIASQRGDHVTISELLWAAKGSKVDLLQKDGCSSLYLAAQFGHRKVVEVLLKTSADVNLGRMTTGQGPLHVAAVNNCSEVAEVLVRGFADVSARDRGGRTPLDLARQLKHKSLIEVLESAAGVTSTRNEQFSGLSDSSSTVASNLSASGSGYSEISRQLHEALELAGFVQFQAALQSSCADALQRILRQRLRSEEVYIVGSYSEGWGNSLIHLDGRTDPESDIDVMQLIQGRIYHLKGVCQCSEPDQELVVEYSNGHIICSGYASSPARPENGSALRPAVDRVSACRLCCYPPIGPLQPQRVAQSHIPQSVLQSLSREVEASLCHVVHAAPPGQAGKQLRVSTTFLERRLLRSLSTLQGQLFVTLKFLVKKVIGRRVQGLKAYHAKTVTFRMLEETPAEHWRPENLMSLVRQSLQMLLDCVEGSCGADNVDGRIMEHFFLIDAGLYLKGADRSDSEKIVEVLRDVIYELPQLLIRFKESLQKIDNGSAFHFHPFLILPEIDPMFSAGLRYTDYYNIYDIVRDSFYHVSESSSAGSLGSVLQVIEQLPDCANLARVCLIAMAYLKFGNREAAIKVLSDSPRHTVRRGVKRFTGGNNENSAESAVFSQLLDSDLAWRFSLMYLRRPDLSHTVPKHLAEWFPLRMENYDAFYYVNFDALRICLACELLPHPEEVLKPWLVELLQRDDADVLELLTALHYCRDASLTKTIIEKFRQGILDSELASSELQRVIERQLTGLNEAGNSTE